MDYTTLRLAGLVIAFAEDVYSPARSLRSKTRDAYTTAVFQFLEWYEAKRIAQSSEWSPILVTDLRQDDVLGYMDAFTGTSATLRQQLAGLHYFGAWFVEQGHLRRAPLAGMPKPKPKPKPATRRTRTVGV